MIAHICIGFPLTPLLLGYDPLGGMSFPFNNTIAQSLLSGFKMRLLVVVTQSLITALVVQHSIFMMFLSGIGLGG